MCLLTINIVEMRINMTFNIEIETKIKLDIPVEEIISKVITKSLDDEGCPYEAELSVILTDNNEIKEINKEFRNIDKPTDVLSFPMIEYKQPSDFSIVEDNVDEYFNPETGELVLGDIIISLEKVIEQSEEYGHSTERELAFLTAHSMLHLFGYDHMEEDERMIMENKQEGILKALGFLR